MKHAPKQQAKQESAQTKAAGGDLFDKLHAYRDQHAHALFSSLGRLFESPFTTLLTVGVLAVALSLAASFYLLVANLQQLTGNIEISKQISLFLKVDVTDVAAKKLADLIGKNPQVRGVDMIGKAQALQEFQEFGDFGKAVTLLDENPLPVVLQVLPADGVKSREELEQLLLRLQQAPEVEFAQLDWQWVERLQSIVTVARQGMRVVSILLGLGVLFITGNTIRLELHHRHDEVIIAKLVGATHAFIKRPFLYTGFWIGFFSGIAAWFVVTAMMLFLWKSVENLSVLYGNAFHLLLLNYSETLALIGFSALLSVVSSWAVVSYQLRRLKPE